MSDDLELPSNSRRIQASADAIGENARRAVALGEPRIRTFESEIDTEPLPLAQVDPEPAHMSRLKVTEEPRRIERPDEMYDQLDERTPQFILRNTPRLERYADPEYLDFLTWVEVRDLSWQQVIEAARRGGIRVHQPLPDTASQQVAAHVAQSRVLMVETRWHEHFGRPDPVAD